MLKKSAIRLCMEGLFLTDFASTKMSNNLLCDNKQLYECVESLYETSQTLFHTTHKHTHTYIHTHIYIHTHKRCIILWISISVYDLYHLVCTYRNIGYEYESPFRKLYNFTFKKTK